MKKQLIPFLLPLPMQNFPYVDSDFDAITDYEILSKMTKKINEIIAILEELDPEQFKEYVDSQIASLKELLETELLENVQELKSLIIQAEQNANKYTDTQIELLDTKIIAKLEKEINNLLTYINNNNKLIYNYVNQVKKELEEEISNISINLNVFNPIKGKVDTLQNTIFDLYNYFRIYGIEAKEFDILGLTALEFDNKKITAENFDLYGKKLLTKDFNCNMYSPFTGKIEPISSVVTQLAFLHKNAIEALEFDNLDLNAETFDNKELTAYNFDWNGKELLVS